MSRTEKAEVSNFLCDTWWYGLTKRLPDRKFEELAKLRHRQGFDAVQLVVGIPPEVGPENPNAASEVGSAWNLKGEFNSKYLDRAEEKIQMLNSLGLSVIVYGAWGQQIKWLGEERMKDWWKEIVNRFDRLDVMYCVTGESDIWVGQEKRLLPDKSTDEFKASSLTPLLPPRLAYFGKRLINMVTEPINVTKRQERKKEWSNVLIFISSMTAKPIFIHTLSNRTSEQVVNNSELLDAITVQTGHSPNTKNILWQLPLEITKKYPDKKFINLEPWYEGITGRFGTNDQLYAYWASMMAGAHAYCYGAHGVWNVGDGKFLAHWGKQTFDQAIKLITPQLIGESHKLFVQSGFMKYRSVEVEDRDGELISITRSNGKDDFVYYAPEISVVKDLPKGKIFLPLKGEFSRILPASGQVVMLGMSMSK